MFIDGATGGPTSCPQAIPVFGHELFYLREADMCVSRRAESEIWMTAHDSAVRNFTLDYAQRQPTLLIIDNHILFERGFFFLSLRIP